MEARAAVAAAAAVGVASGVAIACVLPRRKQPPVRVLASDPRPNAPDGAEPGPLAAGVRTVLFSLPDLQIDIMGLIEANAPGLADDTLPRKPRALLCEVWYPAVASRGATTTYAVTLGNNLVKSRPNRPGTLVGRATRDAPPLPPPSGPCPVVCISHGMSSHRYMAVGLAEWLATRGRGAPPPLRPLLPPPTRA